MSAPRPGDLSDAALDREIRIAKRRLASLKAEQRIRVGLSIGMLKPVLEAVATEYDIDEKAVLKNRRLPALIEARHVVRWIGRELGLSYPEIARCLGCDHTTALYSVRVVNAKPELLAKAQDILRSVEADRQ